MGGCQFDRYGVEEIESKMQSLADAIDYDWGTFTLKGFKEYVESCKNRKIVFVLCDLLSASGGWVTTSDCDYVFIGADLPMFMQNHSALHELGHIMCDHPPAKLSELLCGRGMSDTCLLLRDICIDEIDLEAEVLASLLQERIISHGRRRELTKVISSAKRLKGFLTALNLV